jgi:hypothetical protein
MGVRRNIGTISNRKDDTFVEPSPFLDALANRPATSAWARFPRYFRRRRSISKSSWSRINHYWSLDHAPLMPAALMIGHRFSALAFT